LILANLCLPQAPAWEQYSTPFSLTYSLLIYHIGKACSTCQWCALSMASNQIDMPQPPSSQQAVMTSHHIHPTTAAATMANHNQRATSPIPTWLLPISRRRQTNRRDPTALAASTSTKTSISNHDHIQTQRRPSVPQHEPESSATAHQVVSTPPSPALASDHSVACATKRKAPDVAQRDEEQPSCHPRHITTSLKGRGGARENGIWINQDEGVNIMMETTMALKNSRRRVTLSGRESHSKRARMVAKDSDDGESSRFFTPKCSAHNMLGQTQKSYFLGQGKLEECHR